MIAMGFKRRRHGQGMTEYIILVGLVAILLIAAITRYKEILRITIEGNTGDGGAVGAVDSIKDDMGKVDAGTPPPPGVTMRPNPDGSGTFLGSDGAKYRKDTSKTPPYVRID